MKSKFGMLFIGLLILVAIFSFNQKAVAVNDPGDYTFTGTHEYDSGAVLKIGGSWYVDGTKVTATAATLNSAASGLATNATQTATCSNLTVNGTATVAGTLGVTGTTTVSNFTATGTVTIPAASIAHTKLAAGGAGACIITNLSTLSTNIMWFDAAGCLTNKTTSP